MHFYTLFSHASPEINNSSICNDHITRYICKQERWNHRRMTSHLINGDPSALLLLPPCQKCFNLTFQKNIQSIFEMLLTNIRYSDSTQNFKTLFRSCLGYINDLNSYNSIFRLSSNFLCISFVLRWWLEDYR